MKLRGGKEVFETYGKIIDINKSEYGTGIIVDSDDSKYDVYLNDIELLWKGKKIEISAFKIGQQVLIKHGAFTYASSPARFEKVISVEILDNEI